MDNIYKYEVEANININVSRLDNTYIVEKLNEYYKKGYLKFYLDLSGSEDYSSEDYKRIMLKIRSFSVFNIALNDPDYLILEEDGHMNDGEWKKMYDKYFNLMKVSLKDLLINNNIAIVKNQKYRIKISPDENRSYITFMDDELRILISSLYTYIADDLLAYTNINNYNYDEVFTLDDENSSQILSNNNTINNDKKNISSSNNTNKNILDNDIIKKLFLRYVDNAKKGVLEFENSFKKQENIKDADKKEAEEKIKGANFFILSAEYNIEKENNAVNYINNYNKTIEQINNDFNNIMSRYRKISSLIYVMDVDMEDFNEIYIPLFDINNVLKNLIN